MKTGNYSGEAEFRTSAGTMSSYRHLTVANTTIGGYNLTLPNGINEGQIKYVVSTQQVLGDPTIVPSSGNILGVSTGITLDNPGSGVTLIWTGSYWVIVGSNDVTIV
jgi:hypothetical protein